MNFDGAQAFTSTGSLATINDGKDGNERSMDSISDDGAL
jgi:hypothetical protein